MKNIAVKKLLIQIKQIVEQNSSLIKHQSLEILFL